MRLGMRLEEGACSNGRARASEAKDRARQNFAELTQRAPDDADQEEDQSPENAGVDSMPQTLPSRTSGCIPTIREITHSIAGVARGLVHGVCQTGR